MAEPLRRSTPQLGFAASRLGRIASYKKLVRCWVHFGASPQITGSRLFNTIRGRTRAGMNLAGPVGYGPKRLPSRISRFAAYDRLAKTFSTSAACASVLALVSNQINFPSLNR